MTNEEAVKIAEVLSGVDGGCIVCAENAAVEISKHFPEHPWEALVNSFGWRKDPLPDGYERAALVEPKS